MLLRIARLARLLRLLRLVRTIQGFDALYILTTSLKGSVTVLIWSFLLIFVVQLMVAFVLNSVVMAHASLDTTPDAIKLKLFEYFGTTSRSVLTMFELALANWPPVSRMLQEDVSEFFVFFAIGYKVVIGFSVIGVVNGVFMQETFKVAAQDDAIMMRQTENKKKLHVKKMTELFKLADASKDGVLSKDEFVAVIQKGKVKTWLAAQEFAVALMDPGELFDLLCEGRKELINAEEFVSGVTRLKGQARSVDVNVLLLEHRKMQEEMADLRHLLNGGNLGAD
eukprot:gb/GFBE01003529.1/.p1 GENE.gb/GFBE01003529.1/~~gb/GFBE01003529.1/.p1  ORF type:complete len:281 (+),score=91.17 gb/GFBE01003529.1/:1-843(+)